MHVPTERVRNEAGREGLWRPRHRTSWRAQLTAAQLLLVSLVNSVFEVYQVYMDAILDHARKPSQDLKAEDLAFTVGMPFLIQASPR
jgi:hypothetical protein